ncbi:MAG: hypothetical protein WD601_14745, partial [Pseudohongiellaceae bacterium]
RNTPRISPYEEAQRLQQREDAQNTLAELLEVQDDLELQEVQSWAAEDFNAAIESARQGDAAYQEQAFLPARDFYQQGLDQLNAIVARADSEFDSLMAEGAQAILDGEAETAITAFDLALSIRPDSTAADHGLARAQVLDEVLALMNSGLELHADNQLEQAREQYRQALAVDSEHEASRRHLARVNQDITERDFSSLMSRGYAALGSGTPDQARQFFERAQTIKPDSRDARDAIAQADDQISSTRINGHLGLASEHEAAERWQQAVEEFNRALSIDANVVAAVNGLSKAQSRLNLDNFLEATLENPLRLAEDAVYQQTIEVYNNARRIPEPGPRLSKQLQQVDGYLRKAREPVPVTLVSDGMTDVTLYRVGMMGQFTNQTLSLIPGSYTAIGVREGYRDVRQEFTVAFDGEPPVITIACDEQIL